MSNSIISTVSLNLDEEVITSIQKKKKGIKPNFYMIGNGTMNKHKIQSIDLLDEITKMTKGEQKVIILIKNLITYENRTGEVYVKFGKDEKATQKKFLENYKLLERKNLVRRVKQSHYMVNPNALIPLDYETALKEWNELKENK